MEAKDILSKVQLFFNDLINPVVAPVAAAAPADAPAPDAPKEYELKIGGKVMIDKLEVGGIVMIDGGPALPGELELVDGTKLTVGDNGAITEMTAGAAPAEPPAAPEFDAQGSFTALQATANEKFAAYESKFADYEAKFQGYEAKLEKYNEMITQLLQFGKLMVEAPAAAADPAARATNTFKDEEKTVNPILFN